MTSVVMPLPGADPINHAYHYLAHNPQALRGILLYLPLGAGFAEETLFRGYLFERLGKILARIPRARCRRSSLGWCSVRCWHAV